MKPETERALKGLGVVAGLLGFGWLASKVLAAPEIKLSDLLIEPKQVYPGEPVAISVIATNTGNETGSREIVCTIS